MRTDIVQAIVPVVLAAPPLIAQTIQVDVAGIYFPSEPFASDVFPSINDGEDWSISMTMQVVPDVVDPINGQMVYYGVVNSYALTFNQDTFVVNDVPDPLSQIAINIGHPRDLFTISVVYQGPDLLMMTGLRFQNSSGTDGQLYFHDLADPDFDTDQFVCDLQFLHLPGEGISGVATDFAITVIPSPASVAAFAAIGLLSHRRRR